MDECERGYPSLTPDGDTAAGAIARRSVHVIDTAWAATTWTLARALRTTRFWWPVLPNATPLHAWHARPRPTRKDPPSPAPPRSVWLMSPWCQASRVP